MSATISNRAAVRNIEIDAGTDFDIELTPVLDAAGSPVVLTGYSAEMDIRLGSSSSTTIMTLTSSGGEIVIDNGTNKITLKIDAATTAALNISGDVLNATYDLELTDSGGNKYKPIRGDFDIYKEITR